MDRSLSAFDSGQQRCMGQHRIIEVDYHDFMGHLRIARDGQQVVEPRDEAPWRDLIAEKGVREASFHAHAKVKFVYGKPRMVAILGDHDWSGVYSYSGDDEAAIKYVIG